MAVTVGVGKTPTLSKAANHAAKRIEGYNGIAVIDNEQTRKHILTNMNVTDVWGIGKRIGARLNALGITTALQLANQPPALIRKQFSVLVESTVHELNGRVMLNWDEVRAPKKEIYSTRSFGQRITEFAQLRYALAVHAEIAAAKLRRQGGLANSLTIFATSSPHDSVGYYRKSVFHHFTEPTADSRLIMAACTQAVETIFKEGIRFYRCGVGLLDLSDASSYQLDLFSQTTDSPELMQLMDSINHKYGRGTMHLAGQGAEHKFTMRREFLSPQFLTRWADLPRLHCV